MSDRDGFIVRCVPTGEYLAIANGRIVIVEGKRYFSPDATQGELLKMWTTNTATQFATWKEALDAKRDNVPDGRAPEDVQIFRSFGPETNFDRLKAIETFACWFCQTTLPQCYGSLNCHGCNAEYQHDVASGEMWPTKESVLAKAKGKQESAAAGDKAWVALHADRENYPAAVALAQWHALVDAGWSLWIGHNFRADTDRQSPGWACQLKRKTENLHTTLTGASVMSVIDLAVKYVENSNG